MELDLPALTDKDKRDLKWACEMGADYIAASFIRTGANVRSVIAYLNRCVALCVRFLAPLRSAIDCLLCLSIARALADAQSIARPLARIVACPVGCVV